MNTKISWLAERMLTYQNRCCSKEAGDVFCKLQAYCTVLRAFLLMLSCVLSISCSWSSIHMSLCNECCSELHSRFSQTLWSRLKTFSSVSGGNWVSETICKVYSYMEKYTSPVKATWFSKFKNIIIETGLTEHDGAHFKSSSLHILY